MLQAINIRKATMVSTPASAGRSGMSVRRQSMPADVTRPMAYRRRSVSEGVHLQVTAYVGLTTTNGTSPSEMPSCVRSLLGTATRAGLRPYAIIMAQRRW